MKRDEKFPVEPLSEASWSRIERGLFARLEHDRRPDENLRPAPKRLAPWSLAWAAASVIGVLGVAGFVWWRGAPDGAPAALSSTRIVTHTTFTETVLNDVTIRLEPNSALLAVESGPRGALVLLERGRAHFAVPPRKQRPAFAVQAADVRVEVVGTRFFVRREGNVVRVEDEEGHVRVIAAGRSTLLRPGDSWTNASDAHTQTAPSPLAVGMSSAPGAASASDAGTRPEPTQPSSGAAGGARASARQDQAQRFEKAALLEASDPNAALRGYAGLVAEGGRWGQTALFAMGRLQLELGQRSNARQTLQRYLREHPKGENAIDVQSLLERSRTASESE